MHIYPSLHGDGKYHAVPDGRLLVHHIQDSDSHQIFRCRVIHTLTSATATSNGARIIVSDPTDNESPRMITKDSTITVDGESPVTIPCVAQSHPVPRYRWNLKSLPGSELLRLGAGDSETGGTKMSFHDGVLVIPSFPWDLIPSGKSLVTCEAFNKEGSSIMQVQILRVTSSLVVSLVPKLLIVDAGSNGEFECNVGAPGEHHPPAEHLRISWLKNGVMLAASGRYTLREGAKVLQIGRVEASDSGMFQCFVETDNHVVQSSAELRLGASPPRLIYRFIQQTLSPDPPVSLKCIAKASPTPVFDWFLDGFPLPHLDRVLVGQYVTQNGEVVSHVNISRSNVIDGGEYTCRAQNSVGFVSHTAPLQIYGPPKIRATGTLTAIAGESFKVKCPVAGYPISSVVWRKGRRDLPLNKRHRTSGAVLEIEDVVREYDEGEYTCEVSDKYGNKARQQVTLKVVERPKVSPFTIPESLVSGSRMAVQCLVSQGDLPIQVDWFHGGEVASETPGILVTPLGDFVSTLIINEVKPYHEGNYTCKAFSPLSQSGAAHSAFLRVYVPPTIKPFEFGSLVSGMRAQATCLVQTGDPPVQIFWLRNGAPLVSGPEWTLHQMDTFTSILILPKVLPRHSGNYTCVAKNAAEEEKYSTRLDVRVAPFWREEPTNVDVIRGKDAFLSCEAEGYPVPIVTWKMTLEGNNNAENNFHGLSQQNHKKERFANGTLLIKETRESDEGSYLCEVSNKVGKGLSAIITLIVHAPPEVHGEKLVQAKRGNLVVLKCHATGDPPLTLTFSREGSSVDPANIRYTDVKTKTPFLLNTEEEGIEKKIAEYHIQSVTSSHSGNYACIATNPYGTETFSSQLLVQETPKTPRNLRATEEGSRSVLLTWMSLSSDPVDISYYLLLVTPLDLKINEGHKRDRNIREVRINNSKSSYMLTELKPHRSYKIQLVAVNSVGKSPPSDPLIITTEGEAPSAPPFNVQTIPLSSTEIKVQWFVPDQSSWHGKILGYYVGRKKVSEKIFTFDMAPHPSGLSGSLVFKGLEKFTEYSFVVKAFNIHGQGPQSKESVALTHEDIPQAPPEDLTCISLTSSRMEVTWSAPPSHLSNGNVISYTISYIPIILGSYKAKSKEVPDMETRLENLSPYTNYSISIAASTRAGVGVPSEPIMCTTEEDIPEAPTYIKAIISGSSSVVVAWAPPTRPRGVITKYTLFYQMERDRKQKRKTVPSQNKWLKVTGLTEDHEVHFWMAASTRVGEGMPTRRVTAIPRKAVPAGIHQVSDHLRIARGTDVSFSCPHSGYPTPRLIWRVNGMEFSPHLWKNRPRWVTRDDGSFLIRDVKPEDSANLTCHVTNYHGTDEVTHNLQVITPPSAFYIHALSPTPDSINVSWEARDSGGSPIHRLVLTWKHASGEWKEQALPWHLGKYILNGLSCGNQYQLYLTAFNAIGPGKASRIVTIITKGSRPPIPSKDRTLLISPSSASLHLYSFNDPDCPVKEYHVRLKSTFSHSWIIESGRLPGDYKEYTLPNLKENVKYILEVNAINDAGESKGIYSFYPSVMSKDDFFQLNGEEISRTPQWTVEENLYQDPAFIIPVIISCLALIVIASAIGICCFKKPVSETSLALKRNEKLPPLPPSSKDEPFYGTLRKGPLPISGNRKSLGDSSEYMDSDIRPYATFQPKQFDDLAVTSSLHIYGSAFNAPQCPMALEDHNPKVKIKGLRTRSRSLSRGSDYPKGGHNESDDYESGCTDSDVDTLPSSKTRSSTYEPFSGRSSHHNMLYVASDVSTAPLPDRERSSRPKKIKGR